MNLNVENNIVADLTVQAFQLSAAVGAFDLVLIARVTTRPSLPQSSSSNSRWARLDAIDVYVQQAGGGSTHLATLRPVSVARIEQCQLGASYQFQFQTQLQRRQLIELEDMRNGGDLILSLRIEGVGGLAADPVGRSRIFNDHTYVVPKSNWIGQLNASAAVGVMLMEAALPITLSQGGDVGISRQLQIAEAAFHNGDYRKCVAECRPVYDRLGLKASPNKKLKDDSSTMNFSERVELLIAATRHCTHLPHHDDGDGLADHLYTREEARLLLQITACATSFWLQR
jgi:hypothetical protein